MLPCAGQESFSLAFPTCQDPDSLRHSLAELGTLLTVLAFFISGLLGESLLRPFLRSRVPGFVVISYSLFLLHDSVLECVREVVLRSRSAPVACVLRHAALLARTASS